MSKTAVVRARVEPGLKEEVEGILSDLGLTASQAILMLYRQIQLRNGLPFEVALPNKVTEKTLRESRAGKNVKRFSSKKELYADLGL